MLRILLKIIGLGLVFDGGISFIIFRNHKKAGTLKLQAGRILRFIGGWIIMLTA